MRALLAATLIVALSGAAHPGASDWQHFDGASLRVVVSDEPATEGMRRGALEVRLKPGWKTYWADPGDSGVPPSIELSGDTPGSVAIGFPAPSRITDGYSSFAGYDAPVSFALTLSGQAAATGAPVSVSVFLGICETICVPLQATLDATAAASPDDEAAVDEAFDALPAPADGTFGVTSAWTELDVLMADVIAPEGTNDLDLFVASKDSFILGEPRPAADGRSFRIPLLDRPTDPAARTETIYTLVAGDRSVSGTLVLSGHP